MTDPDPRDPLLDSAYRGTPRDEPPRTLDERIRAAARRAVESGSQSLDAAGGATPPRRPFLARWAVPLSLAVTAVLVVTVTLMVQEEERRPRDDSLPPVAAPPRIEPRSTPATKDAEVRQQTAPPVSEPAEATRAAPARQKMDKSAAPVQRTPEMREERSSEGRPSASGAPLGAAGSSSPSAPVMHERESIQQAPQSTPDADLSQPFARDRALGERPARAAREAAPALAPPRSPEEWLEAIRRLKAQGLEVEAAQELVEFRNRYPNYPLPPDLKQ